MSGVQSTDGHQVRIGHFRVVGELGHGGMGSVYIGLDKKLGRRVALKVIQPDQRLDPIRKARFLREAKVLSTLRHPNVCQFHDFIEGENQDCLVLEMVDGQNLREAMAAGLDDAAKMLIAEQLLDVLIAVHEQGVIHRDLKPANIMVDRTGNIKVLDFGLARPLDDPDSLSGEFNAVRPADLSGQGQSQIGVGGTVAVDPDSGAAMTTFGTVLGTIGYMSPEVARGEPATAASDLFSAGTILQELFTGVQPIPENLPPAERHRRAMWGEIEPLRGIPAELTTLIRRLESLVPENRPTAIDAAEMLRVIRERPRQRRRRRLVAAVWAILAVFGAGMTVQFLRAEREMRRAEEEAATAQQVSDFLVGLFEHASPTVTQGEEITVRELLRRGEESIGGELEERPAVRARMMHTLGMVHFHLGQYDDAEPLLQEALDLRRGALTDDHEDIVTSLESLAMLRRAEGNYAEAEALYDQAIERAYRSRGEETNEVAALLVGRSGIQMTRARWKDAEANLLRAVSIIEELPVGERQHMGDALFDLSTLYRRMHRLPEAEEFMKRCLEIDKSEIGERSLPVAGDLGELSAITALQGRHDEAESLARQSLEIRREILGGDHPHVGHSATTLGSVLSQLERYEEAEAEYRTALGIYRQAYGDDHPYVGDALHSLGSIALDQGDLDTAAEMLSESLSISVAYRGSDHPFVGETNHALARVSMDQGRLDEALVRFAVALELTEKAYGEDSPRIVETLKDYAECLRRMGRETEADKLEARAAAIETFSG